MMTFHPLPRKGEQETQEENNDNINNIPLPYLIGPSPSLCGWGPAGITPFYKRASKGQLPAPSISSRWWNLRSQGGRILMPAQRRGADPLTFARNFPPSLVRSFPSESPDPRARLVSGS